MPITSGQITQNGIQTPPNASGQSYTISWDDFNGVSPDQQKKLLSSMGLSPDEQSQLLDALQKTEMGQYAEYQAEHQPSGTGGGGGGFWGAVGNYLNPLNYLTDPHVPNLPAEARKAGSPGTPSLADIQQQGGLTDVIKNLGITSAIDQASSAQQQAPPAYSTQNLQGYTQNFLLPFVDHVNQMVQGDLSQWGSAIQKLQGSVGLPSNIAQTLMPTSTEKALYQLLTPLLAQQQLTQNYVNAANQSIGQSAAIGAKQEAACSLIQNLMSQGLINPGQIGLGGGISTSTTGTTGTSNLPTLQGIQSLITGGGGSQAPPGTTTTYP